MTATTKTRVESTSRIFASRGRGMALITPTLVVMVLVLLYPLVYSFVKSFFRWDLASPDEEFVGLGNYIEALTTGSSSIAIRNQLLFVAVALTVECVLGMVIALMLEPRTRGLGLVRTLLLLPPMLAASVVGFNFRFMLGEQNGVVNEILASIGVAGPPWLSSPDWVMPAVIMVDIWQFTPLLVLLFIAGLKSLPSEPMEAAALDGATGWQRFWHVTLPLMWPVITVALVIRIIDLFRAFDVVWLMTGGGPGSASELVTVTAYNLAFSSVKFGQASALSYMSLVATLLVLGLVYLPKIVRDRKGRAS